MGPHVLPHRPLQNLLQSDTARKPNTAPRTVQTARGPAVSTGAVATAQYIVAELTKQLRKKDNVIKTQQERIEFLENQVREASIIKAGEGLASVDASLLKDELREAEITIEDLHRQVSSL